MQEAGFSLYPIFQRLYNLNLTVAGANVMPIVITMYLQILRVYLYKSGLSDKLYAKE